MLDIHPNAAEGLVEINQVSNRIEVSLYGNVNSSRR